MDKAKRKRAHNAIDLTGQRFGKLTAVELYSVVNKRSTWRCVCDCGKTHVAAVSRLRNGDTKSCGCLVHKPAHNALDLTGVRFGRLVAIELDSVLRRKKSLWKCQCDCGNVRVVEISSLRSGTTQSCGCLYRESRSQINLKHGCSRPGQQTPEFKTWQRMKSRCHIPSDGCYYKYGGRGIQVCERWRSSFEAFLADMGLRPGPEYSIDRKNNAGHYEPSNCHWTTREVQSRNKRNNRWITFNGLTLCLADWSAKTGINVRTLHARLSTGWSAERALTEPTGQSVPRSLRKTG